MGIKGNVLNGNLNMNKQKAGELHENRMIRSEITQIAYFHPKLTHTPRVRARARGGRGERERVRERRGEEGGGGRGRKRA